MPPAASRILRLAAFRNFRNEFRFHVAHSAANLLDLFLQLRVRNEPADLREGRFQPGDGGPVDLVEHLLPPLDAHDRDEVADLRQNFWEIFRTWKQYVPANEISLLHPGYLDDKAPHRVYMAN